MEEPGPRLRAALKSVFRPLARLLIRNDVGVRPVLELLKESYVEAALERSSDDRANISKTARTIGLTRAETRKLIMNLDPQNEVDIFDVAEAEVLAVWNADPRYHDTDGAPSTLAHGEGEGTFANLVKQAWRGGNADGILERLERRGAVRQDDDGVHMVNRAWNVFGDLPQLLADGPASLMHTVANNWNAPSENRHYQRCAYISTVEAALLPSIKRLLHPRIERFIEEADDQLEAMRPTLQPQEIDEPVRRVGVAAFYFEID